MIDWARVADLAREIGEDSFDEVAALFMEEADDAVARLGGAGSAKALEGELHFLKGAALNLGFVRLATLCQEGERRAATGSTVIDLAEIAAVYHQSTSAFRLGLAAAMAG